MRLFFIVLLFSITSFSSYSQNITMDSLIKRNKSGPFYNGIFTFANCIQDYASISSSYIRTYKLKKDEKRLKRIEPLYTKSMNEVKLTLDELQLALETKDHSKYIQFEKDAETALRSISKLFKALEIDPKVLEYTSLDKKTIRGMISLLNSWESELLEPNARVKQFAYNNFTNAYWPDWNKINPY